MRRAHPRVSCKLIVNRTQTTGGIDNGLNERCMQKAQRPLGSGEVAATGRYRRLLQQHNAPFSVATHLDAVGLHGLLSASHFTYITISTPTTLLLIVSVAVESYTVDGALRQILKHCRLAACVSVHCMRTTMDIRR